MHSIQGHALVASPYLTDPNFMRSVVYILRHDEEGALGLLLNRPTQTTVGSLLEQLNDQPLTNRSAVYSGGPVDGPLVMLQESTDESGEPGLYVASEQARILEVCSKDDSTENYRVFDGYSGWDAGQLESELKSGGWIVWDIQLEQVFADPELLWQTAIRQIGREILTEGMDPSRIPEDPAYN